MRDKVCFAMGTNEEQKLFNSILYKKLMDISPIPVFNREMDSWWDKPYVCKDAFKYFEKVIWIDNDIEIRSEKFFEIIDFVPVTATPDYPVLFKYKREEYNTGLIVLDEQHTDEWINSLDKNQRSDQECFPAHNVTPLDLKFNYLRNMGPESLFKEEIYAYHWTGSIGKQRYLERIKSWG